MFGHLSFYYGCLCGARLKHSPPIEFGKDMLPKKRQKTKKLLSTFKWPEPFHSQNYKPQLHKLVTSLSEQQSVVFPFSLIISRNPEWQSSLVWCSSSSNVVLLTCSSHKKAPEASSGPRRNVFDTLPHFISSFTAVCASQCVLVSYCSHRMLAIAMIHFKALIQ